MNSLKPRLSVVWLVLCLLGAIASWDAVAVDSMRPVDGNQAIEVAARYHLRSRTSRFYQRSRASYAQSRTA